jgi:hypothetical protein
MNDDFLIVSDSILEENLPVSLEKISQTFNYQIFGSFKNFREYSEIKIYIIGYVLPRNHCFRTNKNFSQHELIFKLFSEYGKNFLLHIKGIFCILIIKETEILIFTDHLGICKLFYSNESKRFICSNSLKILCQVNDKLSLSPIILAVKTLLNHEVKGNTIFEGIHYTMPATEITLTNNFIRFDTYYNCKSLLGYQSEDKSLIYFAGLIKELVYQYHAYFEDNKCVISLTGGKDSRTILTALLANNISPVGVTYGTPESKDAVFATVLSKKAGIDHYIFDTDRTAEQFEKIAFEIIELGNSLINIHRGHRYSAFKRMNEIAGEDVSYYAGYMGGELLMGIFYDNLVFSDFITNFWEKSKNPSSGIHDLLKTHFFNIGGKDLENVVEQYSSLQSFSLSLDKVQRQFHGLFEIGVFHHSQDLYLAGKFFKYPVPLFLDIDFLQELFRSYYSFLHRDNKTRNLFKRYMLYEFNLNIQHILFPTLDDIPFAKRGSYNTSEFLKSKLYWSIIKGYRYLFEKKNFPPSFAYNTEYKKFLEKWLNEIMLDRTSEINAVYDVTNALASLKNSPVLDSEKKLLPFSGIVMHYLQLKNYLTN